MLQTSRAVGWGPARQGACAYRFGNELNVEEAHARYGRDSTQRVSECNCNRASVAYSAMFGGT